jgi:hypothetical protein
MVEHIEVLDGARLIADMKKLARERNRLAHDLLGAAEDTNDAPSFDVTDGNDRALTSRVSAGYLQNILRDCESLRDRLSTLEHD